jgi:hypothetical protein
MRRNDRSVGFPSRQSVDHFREARVVRITLRGFAIWLDPFGMLDPQIAVNLLLEFGVRVDWDETWQSASVKDLRSAREVSDEVRGANGVRAWVPQAPATAR